MTNKKIIVDGVDVSGCPHYKTGDCLISPVWCDQFYNCDYKQHKRKEQECEKLKKLYEEVCSENLKEIYELIKKNDLWREIVNVVNGKLEKQLDQLKAENDELKKIIERLDVPKHEVIDMDIAFENEKLKADNEKLKDLNTRLDNQRETYWKGYQKLEKTLIEIKEIAQYDVYTPHTDLCIKLNWVKKKISEVENG